MNDPYEEMAEFHDLFMAEPSARLRPDLVEIFGGLTPEDVVVDVGAGTGVGTRTLARCTRAKIVAIEPSLTMRTVLLARVADDEGMARRVSVVAGSVPAALDEMPNRIAGFVCAHMLGHLTPADRTATLARLARALDGGTGLITHRPPAEAAVTPATDHAFEEDITLGRHRYVARYEHSDDEQIAQVTYSVLDGHRLVRSATTRSQWVPPTTSQLVDEVAAAGLLVTSEDAAVVLVQRAERPT